jgi:hypothetical protein
MRTLLRSASLIAVGLVILTRAHLGPSSAALAAAEPRLAQTDFTYVGAFTLPSGNFGSPADTFEYSGGYVAGNVYDDPVNGKTLFVTGYSSQGYISNSVSVAQVKIPATIKDPNVVGIGGLTTAARVRGFGDPSNGSGGLALVGNGFGSLVVYGGKLIGTETTAYDASCSQTKSAWVAPASFSGSGATGPYGFSASVSPRIIGGGYMTIVPPEWRAALGAPVVSGDGPTSIISCGTPGPSLFALDADTLLGQPASSTVIRATPLLYYQDGIHSSLGLWNSNSPNQIINGRQVPSITVVDPHGRGTYSIPYEDNSMRVVGVLFADGTSSVLMFGKKGMGPYCYGTGSDCGDLDFPLPKGDHAYPYTEFVWSYDVNDLIAVKQGLKNPWDVFPYEGWAFKVPGDDDGGKPVGVAWDAATRLAYMVVGNSNGPAPIVHVFKVGQGSAIAPARPTNLRVGH